MRHTRTRGPTAMPSSRTAGGSGRPIERHSNTASARPVERGDNRNNNNSNHNQKNRKKVPAREFYREYYGHRVEYLERLLPRLRESSEAVLWLAGDSTLDNKYWFHETVPAAPGAYQELLQPPRSKPDIAYWLNYHSAQSIQNYAAAAAASTTNDSTAASATAASANTTTTTTTKGPVRWGALNAAVEASTLNERTFRLRPQDVFVRDNIQANDVLIVSVGGNDVALCPTLCTILSITSLVQCLPLFCTQHGCTCGTVPCDDCCCGCGPSLCSCACACPPCLGYFRHLFGTRVQSYIRALTAKTKPSKILVCMIYYPEEQPTASGSSSSASTKGGGGGWAEGPLGALGYNRHPEKLQTLIRKVYEEVLSTIQIPGSRVIPVPLFRVLNGKNSDDYVARVEPSPQGGRKMAEFLLACLEEDDKANRPLRLTTTTTTSPLLNISGATVPSSSLLMRGRN